MITEIGPKKYSIIVKVIVQVILFIFLFYNIYAGVNSEQTRFFHESAKMDLLIGVGLAILNVIYVLQLLYFPIGLIIDDERLQLTVKYFLLPAKTIGKKDIVSYKNIFVRSKSGIYYGIVLDLLIKKQVLLSELNLDDYNLAKVFLDNLKVKNTGEESFSFFSYYMSQ